MKTMQGSISSTRLPEILRAVYNERLSGELLLQRDSVEKRIFFERGQVVFASSNVAEDRIGETLVRYRKLTRDQLSKFISQLQPGMHLGRLIVDYGILSERELVNFVTLQMIDIVYSLFDWTEGNYTLIEGEGRAPDELKLRFSTPTLILEGIRRIDDFDTIRYGIGNPALLLAATSAGRHKLQAIAFSPLELTVLNMVKEPTDLLKVLVSCKERPEKVLQAVYGLLTIGILEQSVAAEPSVAQAQTIEPPPVAAHPKARAIEPRPSASGDIDSTMFAEIEDLKQRVETRNPRIILGVSPSSTINEIYDAYLQLATKFHPDKYANASPLFKVDIEYLFTAVSESYNILRANPGFARLPPQLPGIAPPPSSARYNTPPGTPVAQPPPAAPDYGQQRPPNQQTWATGAHQPQSPGYYPAQQQTPAPPNPMMQFQTGMNRSATTRAVSDEIDYKGIGREDYSTNKNNVADQAISDLLDYFDDRKAPMFAADALSKLLRTKPPFLVERRKVNEAVITWARNKSAMMGWPLPFVLLRVISLIKQAEQAQLIQNFNGADFYTPFVKELTGYLTPTEADELSRGVGIS